MTPLFESLLTALGVGLLVGLTRERRRNVAEPGRMSAAGLRTHALAGLASAVAWQLAWPLLAAGTAPLAGGTTGFLAGSGRLPGDHARWGVVLLLASSSTSKSVLAFGSGGRAYGARVATGLGAAVAAAAAAAWLGR